MKASRLALRALLLLTAGLGLIWTPALAQEAAPSSAPTQPPDVILILVDDLGYGDWEPTGGPMKTPNLMRLCEEGVRLDRYYTNPVCTPSRVALIGGQSPTRLGMAMSPLRNWGKESLPRGVPTLATRLQAAGYRTGIIGKWHLGHAETWMQPQQRGFDHFYGFLTGSIDYFTHQSRNAGLDWQRNGKAVVEKGYVTDLLGEEAAAWIQEQEKDRPLFLYLPFSAPHKPLMATREHISPYKETVKDFRKRTYCGMVSAVDVAVGKVLEAVAERGRADNTLILFLSDNGADPRSEGSNGPLQGNKGSLYEGGIRVPGVVRWPQRFPAGQVSQELVQVLDWAPTVLAAAGIDPDPALDGIDVLARLSATDSANAPQPRKDIFFQSYSGRVNYAMLRWPYKCVVRVKNSDQSLEVQLFDLASDPFEAQDLAATEEEIAATMLMDIQAWFAQQRPEDDFLKPAGITSKEVPEDWRPPRDWASFAK